MWAFHYMEGGYILLLNTDRTPLLLLLLPSLAAAAAAASDTASSASQTGFRVLLYSVPPGYSIGLDRLD